MRWGTTLQGANGELGWGFMGWEREREGLDGVEMRALGARYEPWGLWGEKWFEGWIRWPFWWTWRALTGNVWSPFVQRPSFTLVTRAQSSTPHRDHRT